MTHREEDVATRPVAQPLRQILVRNCQALTLARFLLLGCRRFFPRTPPLPVTPILFPSPRAPMRAGPVTPARLDPTPTRRRLTALRAAIMRPRLNRNEPTLTTLQQATTGITPRFRLLPDSARMMK